MIVGNAVFGSFAQEDVNMSYINAIPRPISNGTCVIFLINNSINVGSVAEDQLFWPPRSSNLTLYDFHLWSRIKTLVYDKVIKTGDELWGCIRNTFTIISNTPEIFEGV